MSLGRQKVPRERLDKTSEALAVSFFEHYSQQAVDPHIADRGLLRPDHDELLITAAAAKFARFMVGRLVLQQSELAETSTNWLLDLERTYWMNEFVTRTVLT